MRGEYYNNYHNPSSKHEYMHYILYTNVTI